MEQNGDSGKERKNEEERQNQSVGKEQKRGRCMIEREWSAVYEGA